MIDRTQESDWKEMPFMGIGRSASNSDEWRWQMLLTRISLESSAVVTGSVLAR